MLYEWSYIVINPALEGITFSRPRLGAALTTVITKFPRRSKGHVLRFLDRQPIGGWRKSDFEIQMTPRRWARPLTALCRPAGAGVPAVQPCCAALTATLPSYHPNTTPSASLCSLVDEWVCAGNFELDTRVQKGEGILEHQTLPAPA